jgi:hypothetical protein
MCQYITVYGDSLTGLQYPKEIERTFVQEISSLQKLRTQKIDHPLPELSACCLNIYDNSN